MIARSKLFMTNKSQAVRIPKGLAFPEGVHEVEIVRSGANLIITPVGHRWDDLFDRGPQVSKDFMAEREDPLPEERDLF